MDATANGSLGMLAIMADRLVQSRGDESKTRLLKNLGEQIVGGETRLIRVLLFPPRPPKFSRTAVTPLFDAVLKHPPHDITPVALREAVTRGTNLLREEGQSVLSVPAGVKLVMDLQSALEEPSKIPTIAARLLKHCAPEELRILLPAALCGDIGHGVPASSVPWLGGKRTASPEPVEPVSTAPANKRIRASSPPSTSLPPSPSPPRSPSPSPSPSPPPTPSPPCDPPPPQPLTRGGRLLRAVLSRFPGKVPFPFGGTVDPVHPQRVSSWDHCVGKCSGPVFAELKYDGERLIIHRNADGTCTFFSRNRIPVPPHKVVGVENRLNAALPGIGSCVLDSEVISLHTRGTLNEVKKVDLQAPVVYIFDVIYLEDHPITHVPLFARKLLLRETVKPTDNIQLADFVVAAGTATHRKEILRAFYDEVLGKGLEGIVLKPAEAPYVLGCKKSWLKIKRGYLEEGAKPPSLPAREAAQGYKDFLKGEGRRLFGGGGKECGDESAARTPEVPCARAKLGNLRDTVDLAVVGARMVGGGGCGDLPSELLLGLWDAKKGKFVTVAYLGTKGMDKPTLLSVWDPTRMVHVQRKRTRCPRHLSVHDTNIPDYAIASAGENCTVVEVDGEAIEENWHHTAEYLSIRRPVFVRTRADKDIGCTTSLAELRELFLLARPPKPIDSANDQLDIVVGLLVLPCRCRPQADDPPATEAQRREYLHRGTAVQLEKLDGSGKVAFVVHSVAAGGRWSAKGAMGAVVRLFGTLPKERYAEEREKKTGHRVGDVHFVPSKRGVTVCNVVAQRYTAACQVTPKMDIPGWELGLRKVARYMHTLLGEGGRVGEVHMVKPCDKIPGMNWEVMYRVVDQCLVAKGVHVYMYYSADILQ